MPLRRLLLILLFFALVAPAFAAECGGDDLVARVKVESPDKYAAFEQAGQAVPNAEGLLWRIERDGRPASYLFGTMHTTAPDLVALSEPVKTALGQAKTVAVEIADANGAASQAAMIAYVTKNGLDMSGASLQGFAPEQVSEIKRRLGQAGMPEQIATVLKPWFLALTLEVSSCELKKMSEGKPTVDANVEAIGRENGADIVGLESVTEQLDAVSKVSDETSRKMIREAVARPDGGDDQQATTLALYRARRVGWYFAMTKETFGEAMDLSSYADFVEGVVDRRNRLMAERMKPLLDKGQALVAVGALHLPGKNGLVELLRADGYTLEKIW